MSKLRREVEANLAALTRYARALTGERTAAEDLLQDSVARALAAESQWRGTSARAWLFTIMTNLNRSRLRARGAQTFGGPDEIDRVEATAAEPALRVGIDRALASLAVEHREILLMVGLEGLTYEEAGKALGVPIGTVMSRLSRARAAFHTALEKRADVPSLRRVK